jgi:hypothetical protein
MKTKKKPIAKRLPLFKIDRIKGESTNFFDYSMNLKGGIRAYVIFTVANTPFCCGVIEIGELECDDINVLTIEQRKKLINTIMDDLDKDFGERAFMINLNGNNDCDQFRLLIEDDTFFSCVKTFKNPSSGNIIEIWISNN